MLRGNLLSLTLVGIFVVLLAGLFGCGETQDPLSMEEEMGMDEAASPTTLAEVKTEVSVNDLKGLSNVRIVGTDSVTRNGAAAPSLIHTRDVADELKISAECEVVTEDGVEVEITATKGYLFSGDFVIASYETRRDDDKIGEVEIVGGFVYESVTILVETDDLPAGESVSILVEIERDGKIVADAETDTFEITTSVEIEIEEINLTDDDELTLVVDREEVEVSDRRDVLDNITVTLSGKEIDVRRVTAGEGVIIITTEDVLESGRYTVEYNGEGGLEVDGVSVDEFSERFRIQDVRGDDGDVLLDLRVGLLHDDPEVNLGALHAQGTMTTDGAEAVVRSRSFRVERREKDIEMYVLDIPAGKTIGEIRDWAWDQGYEEAPMEAAVSAAMQTDRIGRDEHYLFLTRFITVDGLDYLLVLTGDAMALPAGKAVAAHRFTHGENGFVVEGHKLVVQKR